jgi:hypothetical protein
MLVNFIITAHDKEDFRHYCLRVIDSYKRIKPRVVLAYNGDDPEFPCDLRRDNHGHQHGDRDLTLAAYSTFTTSSRYIKLGIDSFLLEEQVLIDIFTRMEKAGCCYAGNRWGNESEESLATDVIILDTRFGDPLKDLPTEGPSYEHWLFNNVRRLGLKALMLRERIPVHPHNRMECPPLRWTMHHQLQQNLYNMRKWGYGSLVY